VLVDAVEPALEDGAPEPEVSAAVDVVVGGRLAVEPLRVRAGVARDLALRGTRLARAGLGVPAPLAVASLALSAVSLRSPPGLAPGGLRLAGPARLVPRLLCAPCLLRADRRRGGRGLGRGLAGALGLAEQRRQVEVREEAAAERVHRGREVALVEAGE